VDHEQSRRHKPALLQHPGNCGLGEVWNRCVLPVLAQVAMCVRENQVEVALVTIRRKQVDEVGMFPFLQLFKHGNFFLEV
jgi:hypothetical protein